MKLTEDVKLLISYDSEREPAPQLSRQAAGVDSSGSGDIGGPATSASSNSL